MKKSKLNCKKLLYLLSQTIIGGIMMIVLTHFITSVISYKFTFVDFILVSLIELIGYLGITFIEDQKKTYTPRHGSKSI